jgi:hypothetical protein
VMALSRRLGHGELSPLSHVGDDDAESVLAIAHQGATTDRHGVAVDQLGTIVDRLGAAGTRQGAAINRLGAIITHQGASIDCPCTTCTHQGVATDRHGAVLNHRKGLSLLEELIVEAIDLDIWIFMPAPWWAPTVIIYDNDLE